MSRSFLVCTAALALLTACPGDDSSDPTDTAAMTDSNASNTSPTSTSGETMDSESMTGASMTTNNPTTEPMTTEPMTTEPMTTAMTTEMTTDATGSGSGGGTAGDNACEPAADDDECSMCLKDVCCDQLMACRANPDCDCVVTCLDELGKGIAGLPTCQKECMVEGLPPGGLELSTCQGQMCKACG